MMLSTSRWFTSPSSRLKFFFFFNSVKNRSLAQTHFSKERFSRSLISTLCISENLILIGNDWDADTLVFVGIQRVSKYKNLHGTLKRKSAATTYNHCYSYDIFLFFFSQCKQRHGNLRRFSRHKETSAAAKIVHFSLFWKTSTYITYSEILEPHKTHLQLC